MTKSSMDNFFDHIEFYLDGELEGEELLQFKTALETNPELANTVALYQKARNVLQNDLANKENNKAFEKSLQSLNDQYFNENANHIQQPPKTEQPPIPPKSVSLVRKLLIPAAAAASILFFIIVGIDYFKSSLPERATFVEQHYFPKKTTTVLGENGTAIFDQAIHQYKAKNFQQAIQLFGQVSTDDPRFQEALLFQGYSLLENKNYEKAASNFQKLLDTKDARFMENATWHLALTNFGKGDQDDNVKTILNKILSNPKHPYFEDAQEMMKYFNDK